MGLKGSSSTPKTPSHNRYSHHKKKLLLLTLLFLLLLGLALGLGLGLTIGRKKSSSPDNEPSTPSPTLPLTTLPPPTSTPTWLPTPGQQWQILLSSPPLLSSSNPSSTPSLTPNVPIYDLDLFDTSTSLISTLHSLDKKVLCYFSGGSYEPNRPDSKEFKEGDMGDELEGWPGERWVRLGSEGIREIMRERVNLAKEKGCDGVDVDNVDGYQNKNGLSLTPQDSISFLSYLSNLTTPLNLTLGLKNAGDIIPFVLPIVHFSVNEQCIDEQECATFAQFIDAGKPVFHIEYPKEAEKGKPLSEDVLDKYCKRSGESRFSTVLKKMELDGWVEYCDGRVMETALNTSMVSGNN